MIEQHHKWTVLSTRVSHETERTSSIVLTCCGSRPSASNTRRAAIEQYDHAHNVTNRSFLRQVLHGCVDVKRWERVQCLQPGIVGQFSQHLKSFIFIWRLVTTQTCLSCIIRPTIKYQSIYQHEIIKFIAMFRTQIINILYHSLH